MTGILTGTPYTASNYNTQVVAEIVVMAIVVLFFVACAIVPMFFTAIIAVAYYLVKAIPCYSMADKAGYDKPWIAFLPFGAEFIMCILPYKEFKLFGSKSSFAYDRTRVFWLYFACMAVPALAGVILYICLMIPYVNIIAGIVSSLGSLLLGAIGIFAMVLRVFINMDLIATYESNDIAIAIAIVSVFVPIVMIVMLFIMMGKEPEYGFGNYYTPQLEEE